MAKAPNNPLPQSFNALSDIWKMCFFAQAFDLGNLELYQVNLGVFQKQKTPFPGEHVQKDTYSSISTSQAAKPAETRRAPR